MVDGTADVGEEKKEEDRQRGERRRSTAGLGRKAALNEKPNGAMNRHVNQSRLIDAAFTYRQSPEGFTHVACYPNSLRLCVISPGQHCTVALVVARLSCFSLSLSFCHHHPTLTTYAVHHQPHYLVCLPVLQARTYNGSLAFGLHVLHDINVCSSMLLLHLIDLCPLLVTTPNATALYFYCSCCITTSALKHHHCHQQHSSSLSRTDSSEFEPSSTPLTTMFCSRIVLCQPPSLPSSLPSIPRMRSKQHASSVIVNLPSDHRRSVRNGKSMRVPIAHVQTSIPVSFRRMNVYV
jgi:hypothetical protein